VEDIGENLPSFVLHQNYPNPFNPVTSIRFSLPTGSFATLRVFDIQGRLIRTLIDSYIKPGEHEISFDGSKFSSGTYVYLLTAQDRKWSRKMVLAK